MKIITVGVCLIMLLTISQSAPKTNLTCLTGYKILVRSHSTNKQNITTYKLQYHCLCPNNYYGEQCQQHLGMDCYLSPINQLNQINSSNIKQQIDYGLEFDADCWVRDKLDFFNGKIQLRQFLSKYNADNAYGVREQFGGSSQVIWANDTTLFDQNNQLKAQKSSTSKLTQTQRMKILIGNNQKLYETPFVYQQTFLGYGLINGNITFRVNIINPQAGSITLASYSQQQIQLTNLQEYLQSYIDLSQMSSNRDKLIKNITDMIKNNTINDTIQKYINGSQKPKPIDFNKSNINLEKKIVPTIVIPIKLNPYNSTFYQAIRIQAYIIEKYQQIITHQTSMNSAQWTIPVNVQGLGIPQPISKNLTVTDSSNKSYYRILLVVVIGLVIYLGLTYGYKRYKKWKNSQYTQFQDQSHGTESKGHSDKKLQEQSVRSTTSQSSSANYYHTKEDHIKS